MTSPIALPLADTSDMVEMHRVFRHCFGRSRRLIGSVDHGDRERAMVVADYFANVLRLLQSHHEGEDQLLTPKLLERDPSQAERIKQVASQHAGVVDLMDCAEERLSAWSQSVNQPTATALVEALERLDAQLAVHLDAEEAEILPIAARCINVAEWGELPSHGMRHFAGDKQWLITGLIRDELSAGHRAAMDAHMPPPVAAMWAQSGQAMYADFMGRLLGDL
jgi:hemerythrin-like domain-containing protein